MSYQTLYRKYRPKTFDDVVGQKHIIQTLKNVLINQKISHAYLFYTLKEQGKLQLLKYLQMYWIAIITMS
ncbi:hypothetical protein NWE60_01565 [Mycoplasmopsis felis]|nr:hypothetical protein [Mycoplasmopsis felis]WAM01323.1 hypothetical protein NWE60_01565 [Mycoplasmopsis felis]